MDHKTGEQASRIIAQQNPDGSWGQLFHSLSIPTSKSLLTTEQALRRLKVLGFTRDDEPIRRAIEYMSGCLRGERKMDDYWEKTHNWELFTKLMLSAWIRAFEPDNEPAMNFAMRWARVMEGAFMSGGYDDADYRRAYISEFASPLNGAREIDFVSFYTMTLLSGVLSEKVEDKLLDYVLSRPNGIYYVYGRALSCPPEIFASRETSMYLAAHELLSGYGLASGKIGYVADWLKENRDENGQWDFGPKANNGIYFPLSDSWKSSERRKADCTERAAAFLRCICKEM